MKETKPDILQGTLDLMVLKTLEGLGPLHGYGIARRRRKKGREELDLRMPPIFRYSLCQKHVIERHPEKTGEEEKSNSRAEGLPEAKSLPELKKTKMNIPGRPKLEIRNHSAVASSRHHKGIITNASGIDTKLIHDHSIESYSVTGNFSD